ncbi:STAS domain-containing protein [Streptomyces sp. NPDC048639]|uniref:STAS domain-containing protein n=1 Tax=Streptomyces sp. NPDC048639 TaxID=3365581 RepID=UPI00370F8111
MKLPYSFEVCTETAGQAAVVTVSGELDVATAPQLRLALAQCLKARLTSLTVDFSGVAFCDCAGLNVLIGARKSAADAGIRFRLSGVSRQVTKLMRDTGTDAQFRNAPQPYEPEHDFDPSALGTSALMPPVMALPTARREPPGPQAHDHARPQPAAGVCATACPGSGPRAALA